MSKRYAHLLKNKTRAKVVARNYDSQKEAFIWLLTLAATAAAGAAYLFGFFFSFTGGCAPAGD